MQWSSFLVADPEFPRGGTTPKGRQPVIWPIPPPQKKPWNFGPRGRRIPCTLPLDPPLIPLFWDALMWISVLWTALFPAPEPGLWALLESKNFHVRWKPKNSQFLSPPLATAVEGGAPSCKMWHTKTISVQFYTFWYRFPQNGSSLLYFFKSTDLF